LVAIEQTKRILEDCPMFHRQSAGAKMGGAALLAVLIVTGWPLAGAAYPIIDKDKDGSKKSLLQAAGVPHARARHGAQGRHHPPSSPRHQGKQ
jgi:hypothetical protein